jgi:hypothetical protein
VVFVSGLITKVSCSDLPFTFACSVSSLLLELTTVPDIFIVLVLPECFFVGAAHAATARTRLSVKATNKFFVFISILSFSEATLIVSREKR